MPTLVRIGIVRCKALLKTLECMLRRKSEDVAKCSRNPLHLHRIDNPAKAQRWNADLEPAADPLRALELQLQVPHLGATVPLSGASTVPARRAPAASCVENQQIPRLKSAVARIAIRKAARPGAAPWPPQPGSARRGGPRPRRSSAGFQEAGLRAGF